MSPLEIIKYVVEHLQGTNYEPWVNLFLFMLLAVAILRSIAFLLGKKVRSVLVDVAATAMKRLENRKGYAPECEKLRLRVEPYADFLSSAYFALVGLYSAVLVGVSAVLSMYKAPAWVLLICIAWVLGSFIYMRLNLEAASWAYHTIKCRRGK